MTRAALILTLGTLCGQAAAQGEWIIIDRELREHRVELTSLDGDGAIYIDATGKTRESALSSLLAIIHKRPPEERPPRDPPWITRQLQRLGPGRAEPEVLAFQPTLELTDGQRWVGSLHEATGDGLRWSMLGVVTIDVPLEDVRAAAINGPITEAAAAWSALDDRLVLANGDLLEGFVASVGPEVELETAGANTTVPLDRVAGVLLANPPEAAEGTIAWIDDGSVLALTAIEVGVTGNISLGIHGVATETGRLRRGDLRAVMLDASAGTGLAAITPDKVSGPNDGAWGTPRVERGDAPLGAGSIELHGPVRVEWLFDRPAARFAATAELPPANWAWGDCDIVVSTGDGMEVFREPVDASSPTVSINVELGGSTGLVIEIEAGRRGGVQDGVVLTRPLVLWR